MSEVELSSPRSTRFGIGAGVILLHVLVLAGLVRVFSPNFVHQVTQDVVSAFNVTITPPEPSPTPTPPPQAHAQKDAGKSGEAGKKAIPKAIAAPKPKIVIKTGDAPKVASTGNASTSGATNSGNGTGAGGAGNGTGAGGSGNGSGGGIAVRPSVRSGELNQSRDFPIPPGGRQTRFGKRVIVQFTVTVEGRARDCSVFQSNVDAETTAAVCPLVLSKIRFTPAKRVDGTPVETRYGYRVDFTEK